LRKTNFLLGTVVPFQESHGVGSAKLIGQFGDLQFLERLQVKQLGLLTNLWVIMRAKTQIFT
jgi:hypothetical protein